MIIQAQPKSRVQVRQVVEPKAIKPSTEITEKVFRVPKQTEKRYLIVVMPCEDRRVAGYVYDVHEQRLAYKCNSSKTVEETLDSIYKDYKRSDTKVVEPESLLFIIKEVEAPQVSFTFVNNKKLSEDIVKNFPQPESFHVRRIRETYKYIDKYKVKLNVKVEYNKVENKAVVFLYDDEGGVAIGTHKLEYDYIKGIYKYLYLGRLIVNSHELEDLFR